MKGKSGNRGTKQHKARGFRVLYSVERGKGCQTIRKQSVILRCARNDHQPWRGGYRNSKLANGERTNEDMTQDGSPGKPKQREQELQNKETKGAERLG